MDLEILRNLSPVSDSTNENHNLLDNPHVFLTEIMRQAADNEIIRLSMDIRDGKSLTYSKGKDVWIIPKNKISDRIFLGADAILCGTNFTRQALNSQYRKKVFGNDVPDYPINGDKIVCIKNNYDYCSNLQNPLINGQIGFISDIKTKETSVYKPELIADFTTTEDGQFISIPMDYKLFTCGEQTINKNNFCTAC